MLPRFYAPDAGRRGAEPLVALPEDESMHLARVLRLGPGESVRVFNGHGEEWRAEIVDPARHRALVSLREPVAPAPEPRIPITLALAVLKGDKMDDVVRDAVMLGVAAIQPLVTDRTEISLASLARSNKVERWQRIAVSSSKQCGRAVVAPVRPAQTLDAWLLAPAAGDRIMLVEPSAAGTRRPVTDLAAPPAAELVVGPEGGWTERELRVAEEHALLVTMGARTLRADAVPLVALTVVRTLWRDL